MNRLKIWFGLLPIFFLLTACPQPPTSPLLNSIKFTKIYGGTANAQDSCQSVIRLSDGNYGVAGYMNNTSFGQDAWIAKIDKTTGNIIWQKTFGWGNEQINSIVQTSDGGFICAGISGSLMLIAKLDSSGNTNWTWRGQTGGATGIIQDGSYYVASGYANNMCVLVKLDSSGNQVLMNSYSTNGKTNNMLMQGEAICKPYSASAYMLAGAVHTASNGLQAFLMQVDNNTGGVLWIKTYGSLIGTGDEWFHSIKLTSDNGFICAGSSESGSPHHAWLLKTDQNGVQKWIQTVSGTSFAEFRSVSICVDNGFICCGRTDNPTLGGADILISKYDASGNLQWSQNFGTTSDDYGWSAIQSDDYGYFFGGETMSSGGGDIYLRKIDLLGQ